MPTLVFLPGIMGSELENAAGKKVWPPSVWEAKIGGYDDINKLLDPDLTATQPIRDIAYFFKIYDCLLNDIENCGYTETNPDRRFIPFPYDWRKSNIATAKLLADTLKEIDGEIILVGHSMGSLILRYLLESGKYSSENWFKNIIQLITFGAPYLGAPSALAQITGQMPNTGISRQDLVTLTSNHRYPAAYELVPQHGSALVQTVNNPGTLPQQQDTFSSDITNRYNLTQSNISSAKALWSGLNINNKPDHVDYFFFVGSAHTTNALNTWDQNDIQTLKYKSSGDGTVPISSAVMAHIPHSYSKKSHRAIFEDRKVRQEFYLMLDAPQGAIPHTAPESVNFNNSEAIGLSIDKESYEYDDTMEIVVSFAQPQIDPEIIFEFFLINDQSEEGERIRAAGEPITIAFKGTNLTTFSFDLVINLEPSFYELRSNRPTDDPSRILFVVSGAE